MIGSSGALGSAIVDLLLAEGWSTLAAGRGNRPGIDVDITVEGCERGLGDPLDGVVWAQGLNARGGIQDAAVDDFRDLFEANVVLVADTLRALLDANALAPQARGVVLSSIWQLTARTDKVAYITSKAALAGFVPAVAADLSGRFVLNAVLPGVIDTPMTRSQLSSEQISRLQRETPGGTLASPRDVAAAVAWLLDPRAGGVNGQSIVVDRGWAGVRSV